MRYKKLGSSGIEVSEVCLGTMTWGVQNSQKDADQQIEYALEHGINFIDTAELYAIPPTAETYGKTESIIGDWLSRNPTRRKEMILATKICGPGPSWIRDGGIVTGEAIIESVDKSLQRLQTDYIDLYQIHWSNRVSPHFGRHAPGVINLADVKLEQQQEMMLDNLRGLQRSIDDGKIRFCGLSNESPWGITEYLRLANEHSLPRMVSVQNEFNLLHAKDWPYNLEMCLMSDVAYLPWSPLAGGALTGKYLDGAMPYGSRRTMEQRLGLFRDTPVANEAIRAYKELAEQHGLTTAQLSLAWVVQTDGVTSTIIGATSMEQLREDLAAFNVTFSKELKKSIQTIWKKYPVPF